MNLLRALIGEMIKLIRKTKKQPENNRKTTRKQPENNQKTHRKQPENTQKTHRKRTENNQKTTRKRSEATKEIILDIIKTNAQISRSEMVKQLHITEGSLRHHLDQLRNAGLIRREGADKGGKWIIIKTE